MKKIYLMLAVIAFILLSFGCTVNENTGQIRVVNRTYLPLRNVRIGGRLIVNYVGGGRYYDYWYYSDIEGKLTTEGIVVAESAKNNKYILSPGYWVTITANYDHDGDEQVTLTAASQGTGTPDYIDD